MKSPSFELSVSQWFNTEHALDLQQLKRRVVVIGAFQMLCPGCVAYSIPQLKKLHELSRGMPLSVIGVHTVFEHHQAMQACALEAFIHEYRLDFPIGIAAYGEGSSMPKMMEDWRMRGTPSTFVFSAKGDLCLHEFGHIDDLPLGLIIGQLLNQVDKSQETKSRKNLL